MMLWLIIFVVMIASLYALVSPFFRQSASLETLEDSDYAAAQLADIDRDLKSGVLSETEAEEARAEAQRRLLAGADSATRDAANTSPISPALRQVSVMLIGAAPIVALALYMFIGNPDRGASGPERMATEGSAVGAGPASLEGASLETAVQNLQARLAQSPEDVDSWMMLGDSFVALRRYGEARGAFERAISLAPERPILHAALGEALRLENDGQMSDAARLAFTRALELDANEPRARYYLAVDVLERGDADAALSQLITLANDAPSGAPWLEIVMMRITDIAQAQDKPIESLGLRPDLAAQPGAADPVAVLEARIASGDAAYTDWITLAEAYVAADRLTDAKALMDSALERYSNAPFVVQEIQSAKTRLGLDGTPTMRRGPTQEQVEAASQMSQADQELMIEGMVGGLAARLESEPDDLEGWIMLARSYGVLRRPADSAAAFSRAIDLSPEDLEIRIAYADALLADLNERQEAINPETEGALREIEQRSPDHPFALYFLGVAAEQRGDASEARAYWTRLVALLPADSDDARRIQGLVDAL
ncbi:MAG: c-type cytochrome biogenesis protein CcmI [Pseudomonadota bacterium]